jgi:Macrocin-O-methyltransferase (TylF)
VFKFIKRSRDPIASSILCLRTNQDLYREAIKAEPTDSPLATLGIGLQKASKVGIALEFGVYSGTTLTLLAEQFPFQTFGFDSFDGLPEFWRDGFEQGAFATSQIPDVRGAKIIIGLFQDTLPGFIDELDKEISFIHLDADLYSSTKYVLAKLNQNIKKGCILVFDEFMNYPSFEDHEYLAFEEWLSEFNRKCKPIAYTANHEQMCFIVTK